MATSINYITVEGIKVPLIHEEDNRLPMVSMQLVFKQSGSIEDKKIPGLAKMSAKMMNEGTSKLGSIGFAKVLDAKAVHLSAHTGTETFVMELSSLKESFDYGLEKFEDLLRDPNLDKETLDKAKAVTIGALSRKENDYDYVAARALKGELFNGTLLEHPSSGTVDDVKKLTSYDIKHFLKEHLVLSKAVVVIGGDISMSEAKEKATALLKTLSKGEESDLPFVEVVKKSERTVLERDTEQAYVYFGSPYNIRVGDEDEYKGRVATYILGTGGFGSRLMEEIRVKRGLAYSAYARVNAARSNVYFSGHLQTKLESQKEAESTVKEVISIFVKEGVTQGELDQARKFLLGSEPLRVETLSQRLSRTFQEYYKGQELGSSLKELEKIKVLELDDLNTYIKKHTEINDLSFAIVTNSKK
ncbi:MAG: pitrilysin family protein [Sulfurimonadaceae bacterium]